jgi:hypothetical protein
MKNLILLLIHLLILVGCTTSDNKPRYSVTIDGLTNPDTDQGKTFVIAPLNKGVDKTDLQFREYAKYISRAMEAQGFIEKSDPMNCDMTVLLAYGVSDPKESQVSFNQPVFGQTGISSKQTIGNLYGSSSTWGNTTSGRGNYSSTTTYTPSYGITGYIPQTINITRYHRYIHLYAQDWHQDVEEEKRLKWELHVYSTGNSGDLRVAFPAMVAVAQDYLGKNTHGSLELRIFTDDPRINVIKGLVPSEATSTK